MSDGKPDADECELWLRHPATKWLIDQMMRVPPLSKYRAAGDVRELGAAQGYDEAIGLFHRSIAELGRRPKK